jgi:hypothetical protein
MKTLSILLVMFLLGTLCVEAQRTPVPAFKTVQVRPGVIKVPSFSLPAGTATRPDLKAISSSDLKAATEIAPGQLIGAVEVSTTATRMNIELTPKNFLETKGAVLLISAPVNILDNFCFGDFTGGAYKNLNSYQFVLICMEVTSGKQYLLRIPVTVEGTATRSFVLSTGLYMDTKVLFTTTFSGSQEIALTVSSQNTGVLYIMLRENSAYQPGLWNVSKVIISEL